MAITINTHAPPLITLEEKGSATSKAIPKRGLLSSLTRPVKSSELLFFTSQLSLMMGIGTPINLAVKAIMEQTENPGFRETIGSMVKDIEEGRQLSDAMKKHPHIFNTVYSSLVRAGETGGFLKDILDRIIEIQEKRQALVTQLRSTLTYPAILCFVALVVVIFIIVGVLPKFTHFFLGKEHILPFTTRFLMAASASLKAYWWAYISACAGALTGMKLFLSSKKGKVFIDFTLVTVPVIAKLTNKIYTNQMLRILGNLLESQVPLLEALETTRSTLKNLYFRRFIDRITENVREGGRFSKPFAGNPYILASVKQMVATGEETGNLSEVMLHLAEFYDTEVDRELKILSSMIEPIALIFLGAVIGLIVSSVILPLFKLSSAMH
ncbi:MAG: type II secretion system F family protein [Pseudomonadota bacterium]